MLKTILKFVIVVVFSCVSSITWARWSVVSKSNLDFSDCRKFKVEIDGKPTAFELEVASILSEELRKISKVVNRGQREFFSSEKPAKIILRNTKKLDCSLPISKLINSNEYLIRVGKNRIELEYPTSIKAGWIVGKFLRDFCKVKYFSPKYSDYNKANLRFKYGEYYFSPSYFAVCFADLKMSRRWRILNGVDVVADYFLFGHNLYKIIDTNTFKEAPYLFALKKNVDSSYSYNIHGQPDILNYRTQSFVADVAIKQLSNKKMFSIGINDSQTVDERPAYSIYKDGYFRGYPNWSNAVFEFSNEVAKKVSKEYPSAILGLLAYMICEKPPNFKLHKNLLPFYTCDRANNFEASYQNEDFNIIYQWGNSGVETFGIYEYLYGFPYLMPRDISVKSVSAIAHAHKCGARLYYAETESLWAYDAKKMWIITKLLEDCSLDYATLEKQFYADYFKSASGAMYTFFELANSIWYNRKIPTKWLALYKAENALELLNDALLVKMENALQMAENLASIETDKDVFLRVLDVRKAFEITKSAYALYCSKLDMATLVQSDVDTDALIEALKKYDTLKSKFLQAENCASDVFMPVEKLGLYNTERFAPIDKMVQCLYSCGIKLDDIKKLKLKNVDVDSTFLAVASAQKSTYLNFKNSKWKRFKENFSVIHKDYHKAFMGENLGSLVFKNCELSGIAHDFNIAEADKIVFAGNVKNISSAGTLCYASIVFLDENDNQLKRKTIVFSSQDNIDFLLADVAPISSKKVNVAIYATRQKQGDIFAINKIEIKIAK